MRTIRAALLLAAVCRIDASVVAGDARGAQTFEDIYGPSGDSFQAALGFRVVEGDFETTPTAGYGVGVDDVRIAWREYKLVEDATDCAASGACATIVVDTGRSYGSGAFHVRILDSSPYAAFAPFDRNDCNRNGSYLDAVDDSDCDDDGTPDVALMVTSLAEPAGEPLVANRTSAGVYEALLPYSWLADAAGVLRVQDAGPSGAEATVRYEDRWDGSASGDRCRNAANPAAQGFVVEGVHVEGVTGAVRVVSYRLIDTNGDQDGFPDTNETFDLYVTIANKTSTPLSNVVVQVSTTDPKIDCVLDALAVIPALDAHGGPSAVRETPTPFRIHVKQSSDRAGTAPPVACTAGQCSNGAGACVSAGSCHKTVLDDYSARIQVALAADSFDAASVPQTIDVDLDLDSAGPVQTTSAFVEGFEAGFGNFTLMNLDDNVASNQASDGARCQYSDPDHLNSNTYGESECYLGFPSQPPMNDWHVHTTQMPDGGRAYLGSASVHYGRHAGGAEGDTYTLGQLDAVRTKVNVNLAPRICQNDPAANKRACNSSADCAVVGGGPCASAAPRLTFKHQISLLDDRGTNTPVGQAADRAVLQARITAGVLWQKLHPYENVYDAQGSDFFHNCTFDPTDDGNTEDDYYDPTDPGRRLGPSSTCFPEFVFAYLGDTDGPYRPSEIGRASDGPGLRGSLGIGTWVESKIDLARYRGRSIQLRFLVTTIKVSDIQTPWQLFMWNPTPYDDGWYVDDVRVTETLGSSVATTSSDTKDNAALPGCPADPCSSIVPALSVVPASGAAPGHAIELSASGSTADRCMNGTLLYQFFVDADGSGTFDPGEPVLRDYGTASGFRDAPVATTRYGVSVRCSSGGSGNCGGATATATFTLTCGPPPPLFDAALWWTNVRFGSGTRIEAPPYGEIVDLVRGDLGLLRSTGSFAASGATCLANDVAFPPHFDAAAPSVGSGFYYLLRGQVSCNDSRSYSTHHARENPPNPGQRDAQLGACSP